MTRRFTLALAGLLLLCLIPVQPVLAQDDDLRKEIEALKKGQAEIRKQLEEIKGLLSKGKPPAAVPDISGKIFEIGNNPVVGDAAAKLTILEFTDYQ